MAVPVPVNDLEGVLEKYMRVPTNSGEWLINESERKKKRRDEETKHEYATRLNYMKELWQSNKDKYNEARRKRRHEARAKLTVETGKVVRVGRPLAPEPPTDMNLSALQGQAKIRDIVTEHVDYTEIPIPKELGVVFHDTSEHPVVVLSADQGTWPLYHIKPFSLIEANTRSAYIGGFKLAMEGAGYEPPENPTKDPMVYADWYAKSKIDPFKVVKQNSEEFGVFANGTNKGEKITTPTANGRASSVLNIVVQGLLHCLKTDGFNKDTCKKLLRDHFIYFDFGHRTKKNTGKKFNQQKESPKNKENTIAWDDWMEMAKKYIDKSFYTSGNKMGDLKFKMPLSKAQLTTARDAVIVGVYSLNPITRLTPWDSTVIKPRGYEKSKNPDRMTLNYVTDEGRAFFNKFKNAEAVRNLSDPPVNEPFEQTFDSALFKKMLQSWIAVNPNKNGILFPSNFNNDNATFINLGKVLTDLAAKIDAKEHRRFSNRLMRRAYIKWFRSPANKLDMNSVHALIRFMLAVHQTSPLVNIGYVKTSQSKEFLRGHSAPEVFNNLFSAIDGENEMAGDEEGPVAIEAPAPAKAKGIKKSVKEGEKAPAKKKAPAPPPPKMSVKERKTTAPAPPVQQRVTRSRK